MATIKIKQVKSRIKCPKDQKGTLVEKVKHLVSVEK